MDPETREIDGYFPPSLRNMSDSNPVEHLDRHIELVQQEYFGENFHRKC